MPVNPNPSTQALGAPAEPAVIQQGWDVGDLLTKRIPAPAVAEDLPVVAVTYTMEPLVPSERRVVTHAQIRVSMPAGTELVRHSDAQARINALIDDRDSWLEQADSRTADAVKFADEAAAARALAAEAQAERDAAREALRSFMGAAFHVSTEINTRGYNWCEAYLDQARATALAADPACAEASSTQSLATCLRALLAVQANAVTIDGHEFSISAATMGEVESALGPHSLLIPAKDRAALASHPARPETASAQGQAREGSERAKRLFDAVQQFRNEKALERCTGLRATAGFAAMCEAWNAIYDAPQAETAVEERKATMDDALAAGDGTLHGAITHWQNRALAAEAARDVDETNKVLADNYLRLTAVEAGELPTLIEDYVTIRMAEAHCPDNENLRQRIACWERIADALAARAAFVAQPIAREPLREHQIRAIFNQTFPRSWMGFNAVNEFVRAVESAHGIGTPQQAQPAGDGEAV